MYRAMYDDSLFFVFVGTEGTLDLFYKHNPSTETKRIAIKVLRISLRVKVTFSERVWKGGINVCQRQIDPSVHNGVDEEISLFHLWSICGAINTAQPIIKGPTVGALLLLCDGKILPIQSSGWPKWRSKTLKLLRSPRRVWKTSLALE